jgi:hypothetical protein
MSEKEIAKEIVRLSKEIRCYKPLAEFKNMDQRSRLVFKEKIRELLYWHKLLADALDELDKSEDILQRQEAFDAINGRVLVLTKKISEFVSALKT